MTTKASCLSIALVVLLVVPALAQKAAPPAAQGQPDAETMRKLAEGEIDPIEFMRQMGAKEEDILGLQLMSQVLGADMGEMMLLMMLADKGQMDDDLMGMMFFMKALGAGAKQPVAVLQGNKLLVVEDGMVYKIDTDAMKVEGSVSYRQNKGGAGGLAALMPLIMQTQGKAQGTQCLSNVKQLCMSVHLYARDNADTLPTEQWADQLHPYIKNRGLYACPAVPGKPIAFVINELLTGVAGGDIKRPADTVLFFESDQADELPFGGLDAMLAQPRHEGRIVAGFADGHAKLMTPEELRQLLAQDPFQ